ncbi:IclR family transcriptional regulator domain-containing protein [Xylophilus sp.]|uniref:IclR family transcriptional regulator domain-containing protein n=1 Tax=Xylophilus sp. TaxID=2653893 RepID=UPI0013B81B18|nr:IclR family transcriptional regulator C-terminal domain-containing protein [Xylophilus sp.]KAF1049379.1 MAG: Transcriptional regulator KdgR [Xylophilus sp.]
MHTPSARPAAAARASDSSHTLEKAFNILDAIGSEPHGLSQSALAERLAIPRTTAYRLLATLVDRGMVRRDSLRRVYCLGFRRFEMAGQVYTMPDLMAAAALELRDLTGETSYLTALDGAEVVSLERCDGAHSLRSNAVLGQRKPVYCTSQGKAILSALDPAERDAIVRDVTPKPLTQHTIADRRRLQAELKITAARGYPIDDEEIVVGVGCVGAPVVDTAGRVRGAISVAGPAWRLTPERVELLGPEVAEAARRVGPQLQASRPVDGDAVVQAVPGQWAFHGAHPHWCPRRRTLCSGPTRSPRRCMAATKAAPTGSWRWPSGRSPGYCRGPTAASGWCTTRAWRATVDPRGAASPAPVEGWFDGTVQAVCADAGGSRVWIAAATPDGGSAIGPWSPEEGLEGQWRLAEPASCLRWNAAEETLYAAAPASGSILLLRPGSTAVRRLATVPKGSGRIAGLAFDAEGGIWTALQDGWSVVRITADGSLDGVIGLPVPCPTGVEVGGADGRRLYVTSARQPVALDALANAPLSGRLFELAI